MPGGRPDLQGIWTNYTLTPLERPKGLGGKEFYTDQEIAELTKRAHAGDLSEEGDPARSRLRVQGFAAFKLRKSSDRFPRFLLSDPQVVKALQIQPKLGARAEEVGEA